ncbi:MAG TPA: mycofactocin-coupled SDR family oxidoreductase [Acidimicrobiales bacterium]|nr:mycofactocin-coupled SDR family oxidoreductase [Acidimicrobiales bacterium]
MAGRVQGKVALVTGAGRSQGRSHAVTLAAEGADIIAVDIGGPMDGYPYALASEDDLAETAGLVKEAGRQVVAVTADIRDRPALTGVVAEAVATFGRLDVVVANAAIAYISAWSDVTTEIWQQTIDVNLTGTFNTVMATAPHLIAAGGGSVVLISSAAGLMAEPFLLPYVASKHGVTGLSRAFAMELAEHHIRVNSVHPGGVDTPMMGGRAATRALLAPLLEANPKLGAAFTAMLPIETTQPIDISKAVLFLASDESRYVTALAMTVDAGVTQM